MTDFAASLAEEMAKTQAEFDRFSLPWSITAAEAPGHPGVTWLKNGRPCEGWMSHKNYRGPRVPGAGGCKNVAHWRFKPLK